MITQSMQPTPEQLAVADACLGGASLVMEAGAGTDFAAIDLWTPWATQNDVAVMLTSTVSPC